MSQESDQLNPIIIPNELETSTPLSTQQRNHSTGIDPLYQPPQISRNSRGPSHSILKNKTPFNESLLTYKGNEIPEEKVAHLNSSYYSVANDASRNAALHQGRAHKVYFSPTKEVVSYGQVPEQDFQVDLMHVDRPSKENIHGDIRSEYKPKSLFWARIAVDPRIPYVLLLYLQLFFNVAIVSVVLYLLFVVVRTVREDVRHKIEMYTSDAIQEISLCSRQFYRNRCSNDARAPALEETCMSLEKCMNRDPQQIGKSKITAETFADIVNGFLHPISWKLCILFTGLVIGGVFVINLAFGTYRSRSGLEEFTHKSISTSGESEEKQKRPHKDQILVTSTPPNPPLPQNNDRIVEDSTLLFSLPLSGRSTKQSL